VIAVGAVVQESGINAVLGKVQEVGVVIFFAIYIPVALLQAEAFDAIQNLSGSVDGLGKHYVFGPNYGVSQVNIFTVDQVVRVRGV
jgi:hypothetical protein